MFQFNYITASFERYSVRAREKCKLINKLPFSFGTQESDRQQQWKNPTQDIFHFLFIFLSRVDKKGRSVESREEIKRGG